MCEELLDSKHEAIVEVARLAHAWSRNEDEMAEEQAKALKAIKAVCIFLCWNFHGAEC